MEVERREGWRRSEGRRRGKIFFILAVQTSHVVSSLRN